MDAFALIPSIGQAKSQLECLLQELTLYQTIPVDPATRIRAALRLLNEPWVAVNPCPSCGDELARTYKAEAWRCLHCMAPLTPEDDLCPSA